MNSAEFIAMVRDQIRKSRELVDASRKNLAIYRQENGEDDMRYETLHDIVLKLRQTAELTPAYREGIQYALMLISDGVRQEVQLMERKAVTFETLVILAAKKIEAKP